jgi:hypothetical protein
MLALHAPLASAEDSKPDVKSAQPPQAAQPPQQASQTGAEQETASSKTAPAEADVLSKATDATRRAKAARQSDKPLVADRYENLHSIWLKVAEAMRKAVEFEKKAALLENQTSEIESKSRKAVIVLEQTEARRARAVARLEQLGLIPAPPQPSAATEATDSKSTSVKEASPASAKANSSLVDEDANKGKK